VLSGVIEKLCTEVERSGRFPADGDENAHSPSALEYLQPCNILSKASFIFKGWHRTTYEKHYWSIARNITTLSVVCLHSSPRCYAITIAIGGLIRTVPAEMPELQYAYLSRTMLPP
jgi:hypothetical protein